jgi:MoaA/NifB/PqqE/SkfB family radical SAM enzyme
MRMTREEFIKQHLDLASLFDQSLAFASPEYVVLDITNLCNCDCLACWTYSPLLGGKRADASWRRQRLTYDVVEKLVKDLARLGTREIRLTGGGEPLLHPEVMNIIQLIKNHSLFCSVTTNGTLLNEEKIEDLAALRLDILTVSLWAGDPLTYQICHPNQPAGTFGRITRSLKHLQSLPGPKPGLVISNVITNRNHRNLPAMIDYALQVGAFEVYLAVVDTITDGTDVLLLNEAERDEVLSTLIAIQDRLRGEENFSVDCLEIFMRRLAGQGAQVGEYDREVVNTVPCYAGWTFARIMADGNFCPCCRGVIMPTGNIYQEDFAAIWNGEKQQAFRRMARYGDKLAGPFLEIGCRKTCDNFPQNLWTHQRFTSLSEEERVWLRQVNKQAVPI